MKKVFLILFLFALFLASPAKAGCIESIGYGGFEGIRAECSLPDGSCQQGDMVIGYLKVGGATQCTYTPSVQITISGDGCSMESTFSAGRYFCSGPGCWYEYSWTFPQLPSGCLGKTVTLTVTSEGVSASKTVKLSTDPTRDNPPSMPRWGELSVSPVYSTDKVSYTAYAEDDKGLKEIRILSMINYQAWNVVKVCSVSGTSASCTYTGGPYPAGTTVCFKGAAIDTKNQEAWSGYVGTRMTCEYVYSPPSDTDGGKNYTTKGVCTDTRAWEDFCPWEGPRGYCCDILPGEYWHGINISEDGTVKCCRTAYPMFIGPCLEERIINCKNILAEYYPTDRKCELELYDCSKEGKTCFKGACVSPEIAKKFSFSLSVSPSSAIVPQGENVTAKVEIKLLEGISELVSLSCSDLPAGVKCVFSPQRCYPNCNSTLTIFTSPITPVGNYTITIKGEGAGIVRNVSFELNVTQKVKCVAICQELLDSIKRRIGSKCGDPNYDFIPDANKDGIIDAKDVSLVENKCDDASYCQMILNNKTDPCAKLSLSCSECIAGKECECTLSGNCASGLWVLTSNDGALEAPIITNIPPNKITYKPIKTGKVKVFALCFEPVDVKRVEVEVKPAGMLYCPQVCYVEKECKCTVSDCTSGIFIAYGNALKTPIIDDITPGYTASFVPSSAGNIKVVAVCFQPTTRIERSSINVPGS